MKNTLLCGMLCFATLCFIGCAPKEKPKRPPLEQDTPAVETPAVEEAETPAPAAETEKPAAALPAPTDAPALTAPAAVEKPAEEPAAAPAPEKPAEAPKAAPAPEKPAEKPAAAAAAPAEAKGSIIGAMGNSLRKAVGQ